MGGGVSVNDSEVVEAVGVPGGDRYTAGFGEEGLVAPLVDGKRSG